MKENLELRPEEQSSDELTPFQGSNLSFKIVARFIEVMVLPIIAFFLHFLVVGADKIWAIGSVVGFLFISAAYVFYFERRDFQVRRDALSRFKLGKQHAALLKEQSDLDERERLIASAREGEMFSSALQKVSQGLRDVGIEVLSLRNRPVFDDYSKWAADKKFKTLEDICEVLKYDRREYRGPSDYFKATLFRVETNDLLELDSCYYPPGDFPRTERMVRQEDRPRPTAFRCLDEKTIQIIPDVPAEAAKGAKAAWVELYEGQASHYGSMLCVPITIGERAAHTHKVIAVLTVDTNRVNYFSLREEEKTMIAYLLVPFRYYLSFVYLSTSDIS